jgi:ribosome biogenesis GTPase / thiamine phosphate phosphatase
MPDDELTLEALGWTPAQEALFSASRSKGCQPARVAVEDKHSYIVLGPQGELSAQVSGKLLHQSRRPADLPKVGDWVAITPMPAEQKAVIHEVLPRRTRLSRKVPGREVEEQILAANIDVAFVVQALDRTFNPALLQRHLVMVLESGARPLIVLNKADLCADIEAKLLETQSSWSVRQLAKACRNWRRSFARPKPLSLSVPPASANRL